MPLHTDAYDMETGAAHKGDASLHVEFYERKVIEPANGTTRHKDEEHQAVYCRIIVPGDKNFIHDQPVRPEDKQRFPRHWLAFNMNREDKGAQIYGTPLRQWSIDDPTGFNENQLVELQSMGFQTIEQIAGANDMQLQRMGLGAEGLKVRAREHLDRKNRSRESSELAETKQALADLQRQMAEFMMANRAPATVTREPGEMTAAQLRMAKVRAARGKVKAGGEQHASPVGAASHG